MAAFPDHKRFHHGAQGGLRDLQPIHLHRTLRLEGSCICFCCYLKILNNWSSLIILNKESCNFLLYLIHTTSWWGEGSHHTWLKARTNSASSETNQFLSFVRNNLTLYYYLKKQRGQGVGDCLSLKSLNNYDQFPFYLFCPRGWCHQMSAQGAASNSAVSSSHPTRAGLWETAAHNSLSQHKGREWKETYSHQGISYPK